MSTPTSHPTPQNSAPPGSATSVSLSQGGRTPKQSIERASAIIRRYGFNDVADRATALVDATYRKGTVVVIGEVKRGKSSLVNALIGRRDLLPVDVITTTSAPIRIHTEPNQDPSVPVLARLVRGNQREEISPEDLDKWVTHSAKKDLDTIPTAAELLVPFRDLGKILLVDTPGVGGLDEHAVSAALTEARNAGVLLMVCDASTPITSPEMEILRQAREQVGSVIVAVTKTDKNVRRWRSIVEDDKRLISEHLGLDIPIVGVSSLRALDAAEVASEERKKELEQRSGIAELRQRIAYSVNKPGDQGTRTALDITRGTLDAIIKDIARDLKLHTETSDAVSDLQREKAELESFRHNTSEWEQLFQRDISLSRNAVSSQMDESLNQLKNHWTQRINNEGLRVLREKPQVFTSQIELDLRRVMEQTVMTMIGEVTDHAKKLFKDQPHLVDEVSQQIMVALAPPVSQSAEVEKKTKDLVDPSMLTMGLVGAGALTVVIPLAPVAAAAWIGVNMGYRAMRNGKNHLLQWLRETIQTTRMATARMMDTAITTGRTEILVRHRANLRDQARLLQQKIEAAQQIARESEAERKQTITRLKKNQEIVAATIAELDNHIASARTKDRQEHARQMEAPEAVHQHVAPEKQPSTSQARMGGPQ